MSILAQKIAHHTFYIEPVLSGLIAPTALTAPTGSDSVYIADQIGIVYEFNTVTKNTSIFLDVREYVPKLDANYEERGLLGLCFHPSFNQNGRFFIYYSSIPDRREYQQNAANAIIPKYYNCLSEFVYQNGKILYEAEKVLIRLNRDLTYHNSGNLAFGPDGYLYITIGDGGAQQDPNNRAQNLGVLFGKIIRIDVDDVDAYPYYRVPKDNPFVNVPGAKAEIWAYGFRNPWGMTFYNNNLVVADVGYEAGTGQEEVNVVIRGGNYGWNLKEGSHPASFKPVVDLSRLNLIDPIFAYTTADPNFADSDVSAIIGGHFTDQGDYICADYSGRLIRIRFTVAGPQVIETGSVGMWIRAFGLSTNKPKRQIYILTSKEPGIKNTTGEIYALTVV
ncbi:Glucose/Sorbosone dehydrogenase [uncultured virus]|nr:Glucose/Sorbosone dehydrogenase [uncultured virus]